MNYCAIAYTFYEKDYRVRRYAEALTGHANRVDVIALKDKDNEKHSALNGVNVYHIYGRNFEERGPFSYLFNILRFFIKGTGILVSRHLRYRYKVIHIHNVPDFLVFMAFIPKLLGAQIILDIHDILPEFYCQKFDKRFHSFLGKALLFTENVSVRFSNHVIVANDLWRKKIILRDKILPRDCTTLLNYPNLKFFRAYSHRQNNSHYRIVYPGTISRHHGLDVAFRALAIVKKELPTVRLDIYCRRRRIYYNWLISLIDNLGLRENVSFLEPVMNEMLGEILANGSLGIVPKRGGVFASEAFSTKIFEFMAADLPVVASRTKIDEYYFDDSMIMFFEPENHEDLARCIIELHKNPKKGRSLANNAKKFVAKNNWETKKQIYLDLVDQLLRKH